MIFKPTPSSLIKKKNIRITKQLERRLFTSAFMFMFCFVVLLFFFSTDMFNDKIINTNIQKKNAISCLPENTKK